MIDNKAIAKYYDEVTPLYIKEYGCSYQACVLNTDTYTVDTLNFLLKELNIKKGDIVFDAGCGVGVASMYFAARVPDTTYYGVTISQKQADIANELIKSNKLENRVFIKQSDYHDLSDPNNFFDKIFFFESSCYSNNLSNLASQMAKIIKNSGTLLIKDIFLVKKRELMSKVELKEIASLESVYKLNLSTLEELQQELENVGFTDISITILDDNWTLEPFQANMRNETDELNDFGKYNEIEQDVEETTTWAIIKTKYKNNEKV